MIRPFLYSNSSINIVKFLSIYNINWKLIRNSFLSFFFNLIFFFCRIPQGSPDDLLSMDQTVYDKLTPLSKYFYKLCTCDRGNTYCSYKQYPKCQTNYKDEEYQCMLHGSSRKRRDLKFLANHRKDIADSVISVDHVCYSSFMKIGYIYEILIDLVFCIN